MICPRTALKQALGQPQLVYRLLGYAGLLVLAALLLEHRFSLAGAGLLLFAIVWPALWCGLAPRFPALRDARAAGAAPIHSLECLLAVVLLWAAAAPAWLLLAVSLLGLTGVTALGGLRMLLPCAAGLGLFLAFALPWQALTWLGDGPTLAGGLLTLACLLGLAWQAHHQARQLNALRQAAVSRSSRLASHNARLSRYLPEKLPQVLSREPSCPQQPREVFVTVAFLDLVGFAELVLEHSVAEVVDVLNDFMTTVSRLTTRYGGELGKFLGDGVLVYFGEHEPQPAGDGSAGMNSSGSEARPRVRAAAGCVRLARALNGELDELSLLWQRRGLGLQLRVRVGVASGYCALGDWGGQTRLDYTLIGTPVNLASRLQAVAAPGSVVVSSATAALISQVAELGEVLGAPRQVVLKGLGAVMVHELGASAKVRAIPLPVKPGQPDV